MKKPNHYYYLTNRAALVAVLLVLSNAFCLIGLLCAGTGSRAALFLTGLVLLLGCICTAWFWVVLPFRRWESAIQVLEEEYTVGEMQEPGCTLSHGTRHLLLHARELLNPSHLFKINKRQAQYLALQNQINPHFLYNTLESIRSESLIAHLDSVADMTETLASFFRYTISKEENLVSVEEELQNCRSYFRIQQYRFGDRLHLNVEYDPDDRDEIFQCRLPKLTLQPILENSIIHGTELKIGAGNLTIRLERTAQRLLIRVSDDGVGMDPETLAKLNSSLGRGGLSVASQQGEHKNGVALPNVDNRIRILFGNEYGLHVFSIPGTGTDVEITLPAITSDRDIPNQEALL